MRRRSSCPQLADLFAFQDGTLRDARHPEIGEHLKQCLPCRRQLRESEEIGRVLRAHVPLVDDPLGRARLKARLREQHQPARTPSRFSWEMSYRLLAASLAVLAVLGSSLIWSDELQGGSSFTHFWRDASTTNRVVPANRIQQTPATAPEEVIEPPSLPFELALTEGSTVDADGFGEWFYRNDDGLAIRVAIDHPGGGWLPASDGDDRQGIVGFNGHDLVVMYGTRRADVLAVLWLDDVALRTLSVLESPVGGLPLDGALAIVAALMDGE